ncbi:sulfurase [Mycobacterium sp. MFM001]|uniref:MOSC and FAD-binding oxidoreductase domain-containing protein n=1 Tax=Mycobacterium sp. MFM001 TaxID=2049453 RepID=UPI000DA5E1E2|nr:MOSC and FAD-binding oxidoreductase domain-containing protein [Mycobacterium sp. MFM001]GBE64290.1 sulfurase [Mycobacterium sp. MFM001]
MGRLVSVNVGLPKDVPWRGKTVHTGIWKTPVDGPVRVRRLNIDGDGQGDLAGHGGEQRAVLVYQTESYDYWRTQLGRDDLRPAHFGENFTVSGLSDREVCIGDRYRIGDAEFEVTQPRVTCFRVGMRLGEPDMPNLLVSHHRPGFYFRVITEGRVQAGDAIVRIRHGRHELSVADVDALLYLPDRDMDKLRKAVDVPALSPGWQQSFRDRLTARESSSASTAPASGLQSGWTGFRPLRVTATQHETPSVLSIRLESDDHTALPTPLPGQYLTVRIPDAGHPPPMRSYSLSGAPAAGVYRISVKREDHGQVSRWLHDHVRAGSVVEAAAPRGEFCLTDESTPVVLISAGIGATPVLAMLHALAAARSCRQIWWLHTTRNGRTHAFAAEVTSLIDSLPNARQHIFYTASEEAGGVVTLGHLDRRSIAALGLPAGAAVYLCGPVPFMDAMRDALSAAGFGADQIHTELFGALTPINPGVVAVRKAARPHPPTGRRGTGPAITFSRSGLTVNWSPDYRSLLELAETCDVPTRFSCRSGVCHTCVTGVVAGTPTYVQPPLEEPPPGTVLICCAAASDDDLVLDL